jgi:hypothetical protein
MERHAHHGTPHPGIGAPWRAWRSMEAEGPRPPIRGRGSTGGGSRHPARPRRRRPSAGSAAGMAAAPGCGGRARGLRPGGVGPVSRSGRADPPRWSPASSLPPAYSHPASREDRPRAAPSRPRAAPVGGGRQPISGVRGPPHRPSVPLERPERSGSLRAGEAPAETGPAWAGRGSDPRHPTPPPVRNAIVRRSRNNDLLHGPEAGQLADVLVHGPPLTYTVDLTEAGPRTVRSLGTDGSRLQRTGDRS